MAVLIAFALPAFSQHIYEPHKSKGKFGVWDENAKVVIPPVYEAVGWSNGKFSVDQKVTGYKKDGRWGLIAINGRAVTAPEFETLVSTGYGNIIASKKVNAVAFKTGCIDKDGKEVIPFQYDAIRIYGLHAVLVLKEGTTFSYGLSDLSHNVVLKPEWNNIRPVGTHHFIVEDRKGKSGIFTEAGVQVSPFRLDSITTFSRGYQIAHEGPMKGLIDPEGKPVSPVQFKDLRFTRDGKLQALDYDRWQVVTRNNLEQEFLYGDSVGVYGPGLYAVKRGKLQGMLNDRFDDVWPFRFRLIGQPRNGYAVASLGKGRGLVNLQGNFVVEPDFQQLEWNGKYALAGKRTGKTTGWFLRIPDVPSAQVTPYDRIRPFGEHFRVKKNGRSGIIDRNGKELLNCVYDSILEAKGNTYHVRFMGKTGIISPTEGWLVQPQDDDLSLVNDTVYIRHAYEVDHLQTVHGGSLYTTPNVIAFTQDHIEEFLEDGEVRYLTTLGTEFKPVAAGTTTTEPVFPATEGFMGFRKDGKYGFRDERGRLRIANRYDSIAPFSSGLAAVKLMGKWGFVDTRDRLVIQPLYDKPAFFKGEVAVVQRNGKKGIIRRDGAVALKIEYDEMTFYETSSCFRIRKGKQYGVASDLGKIMIEPRFEWVELTGEGQVMVKDGLFGVITLEGMAAIPIQYDRMIFLPGRNAYLAKVPSGWKDLQISN